jgi:hypothetical protein
MINDESLTDHFVRADMASDEVIMTDGLTLMDAMSAFEVCVIHSPAPTLAHFSPFRSANLEWIAVWHW